MALGGFIVLYKSNFRFPWLCVLVDVGVEGNSCSLVATLHSSPLVVVLEGKRMYISFNPIPIVMETSIQHTSIHAGEQET